MKRCIRKESVEGYLLTTPPRSPSTNEDASNVIHLLHHLTQIQTLIGSATRVSLQPWDEQHDSERFVNLNLLFNLNVLVLFFQRVFLYFIFFTKIWNKFSRFKNVNNMWKISNVMWYKRILIYILKLNQKQKLFDNLMVTVWQHTKSKKKKMENGW